jgi:outer membrane protein assembly factor BamB
MDNRSLRSPLRLWPGVTLVALQWLIVCGVMLLAPDQTGVAIIVGIAAGLLVLLWWLFLSRASWVERFSAAALVVLAVVVVKPFIHQSIANGMMGFMRFVYGMPLMSLALVTWAAATRGRAATLRRRSMAVLLLACLPLALVRTNGLSGSARSDFEWRWTPTAEERLLARGADESPATITPPRESAPKLPSSESGAKVQELRDSAPATTEPTSALVERRVDGPVDWPGFRGPARDGVVRGVHVETDWVKTPPVALWRHPIGPGWSSFAVAGDVVYTQEQRGEEEVVSAYLLKTGAAVWRHRDRARFWESNAGPGPRATPTLDNGRVYTLGATGILNALDARGGSVVWSRNAVTDTGKEIPDWGIASSPLVVDDTVIVATAGWLAAYDAGTGEPRWFGPKEGSGYSSPHLVTIDGVQQVVLVNGSGVIAVAPADGKVLWKHEWPGDSIVQPVVVAGRDLLIGSGSGLAGKSGVVRIGVARAGDTWTVTERWTSTGLKPYFNDFVVHDNHAFGFDGGILACIDLENGARTWKGGRYGHGQLVLLPEQNLLLVLSEEGEVALVSASADKFTEVAKFSALEGKTWNHPVLVGDTLLVRNGEQMAAFRLR